MEWDLLLYDEWNGRISIATCDIGLEESTLTAQYIRALSVLLLDYKLRALGYKLRALGWNLSSLCGKPKVC